MNVITLASDLIRCPSVTPKSAGVMDVLQQVLEPLGFVVHRIIFSEDGYEDTENLYARLGTAAPNFCFAGHTDVVPAGDESAWTHPPFEPVVKDGVLFGRGAEDMKGAIAAFVAAVARFISLPPLLGEGGVGLASSADESGNPHLASPKGGGIVRGSISLLITNDEEGSAVNGTQKALAWLREKGEIIDHCIVGEPTNPTYLGEMMKVGRRGSVGCTLTVKGKQGHVAYPQLADNPITKLVAMLYALKSHSLDAGSEYFPPSNLEVTTIDVGNNTGNVIPQMAKAQFNIRFNDHHTGESLLTWIHQTCQNITDDYELYARVNGEAFLTRDTLLPDLLEAAVKKVTGHTPQRTTTGGTSDARFIKNVCPVIEFGTTGLTPHMVDECVKIEVLEQLSAVYEQLLRGYFK